MNLRALQTMTETLKEASISEDLPWYTTAAGSLLGAHGGGALVPKKYKLLGQVAGTLAGTATGLESGKYLGKKLEKKAEEEIPHPAKTIAKGLGGLVTGVGLGYAVPSIIDAAGQKYLGHKVLGPHAHKASRILGGAAGAVAAGTQLFNNRANAVMRQAIEDHKKRRE
jgi:hypothetical protein